MAWQTVAEGTNLWSLKENVADMRFNKGDQMKIIMSCPGFEWLFDLAGAELVFKSVTPDGWDIIDVYGENGQGIIDMEADPAWLLATLIFIKAHWLAIAIAGFLLTTIISYIVIMVKFTVVAKPTDILMYIGIIGGLGLLAYALTQRARAP